MNRIFCISSNCVNYFEDMCLLDEVEIGENRQCESFTEGENEIYKKIIQYNDDGVVII